jgi:hypothetical protein
MNWSELKQKATPYIEKATPYVEKAKTYGGKALDFTQKQLQNTPIVLKTMEEYDAAIVDAKRLILIGYDESNPLSQELLLRSPVWSANAWTDNASLRFYTYTLSPDITSHLGALPPVDMRVYFQWNEVYHLSDIESIKNWWKNRNYATLDPEAPETNPK